LPISSEKAQQLAGDIIIASVTQHMKEADVDDMVDEFLDLVPPDLRDEQDLEEIGDFIELAALEFDVHWRFVKIDENGDLK